MISSRRRGWVPGRPSPSVAGGRAAGYARTSYPAGTGLWVDCARDELMMAQCLAHGRDPSFGDEVVGVAQREGSPPTGGRPRVPAGTQPGPRPRVDEPHPGVGGAVPADDPGGAIRRAVVGHDDFPGSGPLL